MGISRVGMGNLGMTGGMMIGAPGGQPSIGYFARMRPAWTMSGMAGYGRVVSIMFIITLTSSPVTLSVDAPGSSDGVSWNWVMKPSMSTVGVRSRRTMTTTRLNGRSNGLVSKL